MVNRWIHNRNILFNVLYVGVITMIKILVLSILALLVLSGCIVENHSSFGDCMDTCRDYHTARECDGVLCYNVRNTQFEEQCYNECRGQP